MKRVTDLNANEVIHCPTKEEFEKIISLNPENGLDISIWDRVKINTCYYPNTRQGKGEYSDIYFYKSKGYTIHQAKDFLEPEFEWGKLVEVRDSNLGSWKSALFVGMNPNKESKYKYVATIRGSELSDSFIQCRKQILLTLKITKGEEVILEKEITEKEMKGLKNE